MHEGNSLSRSFVASLAMGLAAGTAACHATPSPAPVAADTTVTAAASHTITCRSPGVGFGSVVPGTNRGIGLPFVPLQSLKGVPNPVLGTAEAGTGGFALRPDLAPFIADVKAAIQLGKALYWDMQASSDERVACATCHSRAGADARTRHQLSPGPNGTFDARGPNEPLAAADFPLADPTAGRNVDDVVGSQGVRAATFAGVDASGVEHVTPVVHPVFGTARQVTGLQAPANVNAVFNHRNFWNGRAQPEFNGVNPWGERDAAAHVYAVTDARGTVAPVAIRIPDASLASQAVGPIMSSVEMSAEGRTFPALGKKLLGRKPLAGQRVDPGDSSLGALADSAGRGLATTYAALVQRAFQPRWWASAQPVVIDGKAFSLPEANFSLFWGLSVMLYEATLVADDSPMDRYVASRSFDLASGLMLTHNPALLDPVVDRLAAEGVLIPVAGGGRRPVTREDILTGLDLFEKPVPLAGGAGVPAGGGVGCTLCHVGAETTAASVRSLTAGLEPAHTALRRAGFDLRMERQLGALRAPPPAAPLPMPPVPAGADVITYEPATYSVKVVGIAGQAVAPQPLVVNAYDTGWYNVGVRPTADDAGLGGKDAAGRPLSWVGYLQQSMPDTSSVLVPGGGLGCVDANGEPVSPPSAPHESVYAGEVLDPVTGLPLLSGPLRAGESTDTAGTFKTPGLRNVEFTGPYFHNGGKSTLRQVIEFYDDGGNFVNPTLAPLVRPLGLTPDQVAGLVAFLVSLTDERTIYQRAPFDHPELVLPTGQSPAGDDLLSTLPAVGAGGVATPAERFLGLNPFDL